MSDDEMAELDPFELPDWLGTAEVTWHARAGGEHRHLVHGELTGPDGSIACDLLAVDQAYPVPVAGEPVRRRAHQAWRNGEVLLVEHEGRPTLAVPGSGFTADRVLTALTRLARAVGAQPDRYVAALRLGVRLGDD